MAEDIISAGALDPRRKQEAVCIHTDKIFDSCMDKDCIEDLHIYLGPLAQAIINATISIRPKTAELLDVAIHVDDIAFNRGCYTVDVTYFYRVCGEAYPSGCKVTGLAIFEKRVVLYGGEGGTKVFSSDCKPMFHRNTNMPTAVVEAVDPLALSMKVVDGVVNLTADNELENIPTEIAACFEEELRGCPVGKQLYVTLGQFSIIRLERDTQLLIPIYDYCVPEKECIGSEDDPCALFASIPFPLEDFFPPKAESNQCRLGETT